LTLKVHCCSIGSRFEMQEMKNFMVNAWMVAIYYDQQSGQMAQVLSTEMYSEFLPNHVRRGCLIKLIQYVDAQDALVLFMRFPSGLV
jgi:hypothetical protein